MSDPSFPSLHGRPARGWVNDPNGLCRVDGRWHVFFQWNPDAPRHDRIHWGHASSDDLLAWQQEPVALAPRAGELDAHGCWSGCAVVDDGTPTLVYSAAADGSGSTAVLLARSSDEEHRGFSQEVAPVATMPDESGLTDMRDPFLFTFGGRRFAVQGAGGRGRSRGGPRLLVHGCDDLDRWEPLGDLVDARDPVAAEVAPADVWECPNVVRLGDRWVVVVSLWRDRDGVHVLAGVRWLVGEMEATGHGPRFRPTAGGLLDTGAAYYAPQVLAEDDRALLWAWAWELRPSPDVDAAGWAGSLTFPRELALVDDVVVSRPARELTGLRRDPLEVRSGQPFSAPSFEVSLPPGHRVTLRLVAEDGTAADVGVWDVPSDPLVPPCVLVDGSMVEAFPGGPTSHTTRAYPTTTSRWQLDVDGRSPTDPLAAWHLGLPPDRIPASEG